MLQCFWLILTTVQAQLPNAGQNTQQRSQQSSAEADSVNYTVKTNHILSMLWLMFFWTYQKIYIIYLLGFPNLPSSQNNLEHLWAGSYQRSCGMHQVTNITKKLLKHLKRGRWNWVHLRSVCSRHLTSHTCTYYVHRDI